jgi:type VI secretion system protein ImpC
MEGSDRERHPDFSWLGQEAVLNAKRPLRIAIPGISARAPAVADPQTGAELGRRNLKVEFDTLEDAMQRLQLSLTLPLADQAPVTVEFADLDAFHPDAVAGSVPLLRTGVAPRA